MAMHTWGQYLLEREAEARRERKLREEALKRAFSADQEEPFQYDLPYPRNRPVYASERDFADTKER